MLNFKEEQTYICTNAYRPWWTKGKEYKVVPNKSGELCLIDDEDARWPNNYLKHHGTNFKLKETQSNAETEKRKYTAFDVNKVILRAYNMYDNDAQRLAFIKGYFAK